MYALLHPEGKPRVLFTLVHMFLICVFHLKYMYCVIVMPRYLMESTFLRTVLSKV